MESDADLKEIREGFQDDDAQWADIRKARDRDIQALTPDSTWDAEDRAARKAAGRPCLSFDELGQYVNQLVNDARETKRAIEVNPAGDETSEADARFIGALIRQIEYRSNAQLAYTQMFEDAASGGYGWLRVQPTYTQQTIHQPSARSFDQELRIEPIPNPNLVTPGYFVKPDLSDCKRIWVDESYSHAEFGRRWSEARIKDFKGGLSVDAGPRWVSPTRIWVRELWELKARRKQLALLPSPDPANPAPRAIWVDTIPKEQRREVLAGATAERWVDQPYVCQTLTNGVEVLEEKKDYPGSFLPIIGCVGKILWTEDERIILSLIRNALDAQQLYNYNRTSAAEILGMTPKVPWFYYQGALDASAQDALENSNRVPVGAIGISAAPEGWNPSFGPVPFPQRNTYEPPIQAFEMSAEAIRRAIQSATGTGFLPTEAQRVNQKSGVALQEIASSAQKGAFHFVDHYEHAIRRVGEVLVDLIPHYYDTARDVHVRSADDKTQMVRINDKAAAAPTDFGGQPIDLTASHEFDITLSTGPSKATERDKASDFADQFVTARPEALAMFMDLIIKLKNLGPIGDKMAERAFAMLPPAIQQLEKGGQPLPPQAQQAMAQLQQAQQMIQQLQRVIETEQIKGQNAIQLKQIEGQIKLALAELQGRQKREQLAVEIAADMETREDEQAHDMAKAGANAAQSAEQAERQASQMRRDGATAHLRGLRPSADGAD